MGIPYGVTYVATVSASEWRPVTCEHCRCEFAYRLTRTARAQSTSYLFIDREGHKEAATQGAEVYAEKALEGSFDPVPCPDCGKYQEYMHRSWRSLRARPFLYPAGIAGFVAPILWAARVKTVPLVLLGVVGAALFGYWWMMNRTDPDANAAARAGSRPPRDFGALRRDEYEQVVAAALAQGADPKSVQVLSWKGATNVARVAA